MATTQDPIEQVLGKLGELGLPVAEIGERAAGLFSQVREVGTLDPFELIEQVQTIDPAQIDVSEILAELKAKVEDLDPALKLPLMAAGGLVAARVLRWIIR